MQRGQGQEETYREAWLIIRETGDSNVDANVSSVRANVWATSASEKECEGEGDDYLSKYAGTL